MTDGIAGREKLRVYTRKWPHTVSKTGCLENKARTQTTSQPNLPVTNGVRFLETKLNSMYLVTPTEPL